MTASVSSSGAPVYNGVRPYPTNRLLPWEHSPQMRVDASDPLQWIDHVSLAKERLSDARGRLEQIVGEPIPHDPDKRTALVAHNMELARKDVYAFHLWDEKDPRFATQQEIPRFRPDGTMLAEDAARLGADELGDPVFDPKRWLHPRPSAGHHLEWVLYRAPKDRVQQLRYGLIEQAIAGTEEISRNLSYRESRSGMPAIERSIAKIDQVNRLLDDALDLHSGNPDERPGNALLNRWRALPTAGKVAVAGAGLAVAGAAVAGATAVVN